MDEQPSIAPPPSSPEYAQYPRQNLGSAPDAHKLYHLARSYWGENYALLGFLWLAFGACGFALGKEIGPVTFLIGYALMPITFMVVSAYAMKEYALATGASPILYIFLGAVLGIVGIIGLAIVQMIALAEMKKFDLKPGCMRPLRLKHVEALWQDMCRQQGLPVQKLNIIGKAVI